VTNQTENMGDTFRGIARGSAGCPGRTRHRCKRGAYRPGGRAVLASRSTTFLNARRLPLGGAAQQTLGVAFVCDRCDSERRQSVVDAPFHHHLCPRTGKDPTEGTLPARSAGRFRGIVKAFASLWPRGKRASRGVARDWIRGLSFPSGPMGREEMIRELSRGAERWGRTSEWRRLAGITGGVPVHHDMGGLVIVLPDFQVTSCDHEGLRFEPVEERHRIWALVRLADQFSVVRDLVLPARPAGARDCADCEGTGRAPAIVGRMGYWPGICGRCCGLGWLGDAMLLM
jgi:hypothetical protein